MKRILLLLMMTISLLSSNNSIIANTITDPYGGPNSYRYSLKKEPAIQYRDKDIALIISSFESPSKLKKNLKNISKNKFNQSYGIVYIDKRTGRGTSISGQYILIEALTEVKAGRADKQILKILVNAGVDINKVFRDSWSAKNYKILDKLDFKKDINLVKYLFSLGLNTNPLFCENITSGYPDYEKITLLLKYKIDTNLQCDKISPLALATAVAVKRYSKNQDELKVINALYKHGFKNLSNEEVDLILSKVTGYQYSFYINTKNFEEAIRILKKLKTNIDTTTLVKNIMDSSRKEHEIKAAGKFLPKTLKYLPDVNFVTDKGYTLLIWAAKNNKYKLTKELISMGADIKSIDDDGYTALSYAQNNHNKNMIKLIKGGTSGKQTGIDKLLAKKSAKLDYNSFALIIGISKYMNETNVDYADNSAKSFKLLAENVLGVPKENIIMLTNEKATSGQLKSNIELISQLVEKGSTLYFYYAGHGVPATNGKTYILPSDMKADNIQIEKGLAISNIYDRFAKSPAKKVIVFMDSCFSGKDDSGALLYKGVAPVLRNKKATIDKRKIAVFSAGSSSDFANQYKEEEQRMFSYFVMKGLLDGKKNSDELSNYVKMSVKRKSLRLGLSYKQVPQYDGKASLKIIK